MAVVGAEIGGLRQVLEFAHCPIHGVVMEGEDRRFGLRFPQGPDARELRIGFEVQKCSDHRVFGGLG